MAANSSKIQEWFYIVNALITFSLTVAPLFIAGITLLEPNLLKQKPLASKERVIGRIVKRVLFLGIVGNFFFLFLYSIYESDSIARVFWYLCKEIDVRFILFALILNVIIIVVLKCGKISVRLCQIQVSKPILALIFVPLFLIVGSLRFKEMYGIVPVEQLIFHLMMPGNGANLSMVYKVLVKTVVDSIMLFVLLLSALSLEIKIKSKTVRFNAGVKYQRISAIVFFVIGFCFFTVNMGIFSYIASSKKEPSTLYEEHYIDPNNIEVTFPEQKRNLIVIFVESLETGFLTQDSGWGGGGAFLEQLMPNVEALMKNNINFSANNGLGGAHQLYGTEWTVAGITAQYSGVPLTVGFLNQTAWNNYGLLGDKFLSNASGVGDILHKAGYKSYFILGSEIEFGGRDKYFKTHKDMVIYDYHYFLENGYIPEDYNVWWGFEDRKLYAFAKEKIADIAGDEPFLVTLLTADTHPSDGYLDGDAVTVFDAQYKNVLFDADKQLFAFLEWLKEQEFYERTTVVVLGDHLYQDSSFFPQEFRIHLLNSKYAASYQNDVQNTMYTRFPVNIFINSLLSEENTKNRSFSHFDIFPALIDSIGGVYDAIGLALGRSMHKGETTLLEKFGVNTLNDALQQKSLYYNSLWLGEGVKQ
jgi:phosphoglycerol transferase